MNAHLGCLRAKAAVGSLVALAVACAALATPEVARPGGPIPVLAYYYIWYDASSWDRAKTTYPSLGRYSSDDVAVMRRHAQRARAAGIDGFIVSWKSTPSLNSRLTKLVRVADETGLKLEVIYEGLDFSRNPLPVARVASDLEFFARRFAPDRAFDLEGKPVVIWSGTWRFTRRQIASVAARVRGRIQLLASEKSTAGYRRLRGLVDGDAYYWSSVNPRTTPGYARKLAEMSAAVHSDGGLWVAPAAPGFDARLVGGTRVVPRDGGATLRSEWNAAMTSSPDILGLISWNEFSENSEIEPTKAFGNTYLSVVSDLIGTRYAVQGDFDSSASPPRQFGYALPLLIGIVAVLLTGVGAYLWRREVRRALERAA